MKMFVWKNVLCDYTCGVAVVHAESYEEALKFIYTKAKTGELEWETLAWEICDYSCPLRRSTFEEFVSAVKRKPEVIDSVGGIAIYGGG